MKRVCLVSKFGLLSRALFLDVVEIHEVQLVYEIGIALGANSKMRQSDEDFNLFVKFGAYLYQNFEHKRAWPYLWAMAA